jgi:ribosome-associated heat shock protein Hsp15
MVETPVDRQRLDKWLWHARVVRTRTAAQALVESGKVRVNRERTTTVARPVRIGDVLTIAQPGGVRVIKVIGFSDRRGAPDSVADLWQDVASPPRPLDGAAD